MYRGTFRYKGWCETLDFIKGLNMLDDKVGDYSNMSYAGFLAERAGCDLAGLRGNIASKMGLEEDSIPLKSLEFLGFFSGEKLNYSETSPFEITSDRMIGRMSLSENDSDVVMMQHIFLASFPGGKRSYQTSMLDFGSPATNTAVARTVPAGFNSSQDDP
jgi:saccharopine dehydrogenase-like NADP-dependent oxidoreductase